tara:strand:+ start:1082 stop:1678 length:597 start_codon:yes stop_codon:yes gene_type:complete
MKKLFKLLFSINRIDLIKQNLKVRNPSILEIGIHKGDFSKQLISNFDPNKLILVDPWIAFDDSIYKNSWYGNSDNSNQNIQDKYYANLLDYFKKQIYENKVEIYRKTSDDFFLKNKHTFDLIYIDGNHLFEFVKRDIHNSLNFINCDGIIVLDDYALKGWWDDGITKAVNFHLKEKNIKIIRKHNIFDYHHQCLIKKN